MSFEQSDDSFLSAKKVCFQPFDASSLRWKRAFEISPSGGWIPYQVRFHGAFMRKHMIALVLLGLASNAAPAASESENQASSFANIYATVCLKYLNNLDELREKLKSFPKLPQEKASHFLAGYAGDAWPVPDKYGTFVLALPTEKNICLIHARRADTEAAKKQFTNLVATAPSPLSAKQVRNEQGQTAANGPTHTVAYEWSIPNAPRKLLFVLTTAPSESAQIQVLGSASISQE